MAKNQTKKWWKSKTLWVNTLVFIGGLATALAGELEAGGTLTIIGVFNVILRLVTKTKIE